MEGAAVTRVPTIDNRLTRIDEDHVMMLPGLMITTTLLLSISLPALAQQGAATATPGAAVEAMAPSVADAEVRRIDRDAGKITLKHGPIKSLDMPPMTMVFQVKDKALLDGVKPGDKVKFTAIQSTGGAYTVTSIEPAK